MDIEDVALIIKAEHRCAAPAGLKGTGGTTVAGSLYGKFFIDKRSNQLYAILALLKNE